MKIKNNKTTISKVIIFTLFLFTIITLSFSNIKGQEINIYVNKDSNITNPDGTYNNPFKTLEDAISNAGNNATIMIQTDFSIDESNLNINEDLIIMSSDKTIEGVQNNTKFQLNTKSGNIFVEPGNSLTLQNIIINGNASNETPNTKQAIQVGKIDSDQISKLIINDETLIKNTHRANDGGSAIVLSNAELHMNGGEISNNFNNTGLTIIGVDSGRENHSSIYLTGGNIINNNISGSVIATHKGLKELVIGGNININNNQNGLSIPTNGVKVKDDLTGEVVFNVGSGDLYNNTINMTVEGTNKNFYNISPLNNLNLYAIHKGNGEYVWDYKYDEVPSLIDIPSFDIEGSYGNKSIGGDIYINKKNLPVLNAEDYNILEVNGNFIFEYKEETEIKIQVSYEDYLNYLIGEAITEFEEYAKDLDGSYEDVISGLKVTINNTGDVYEVENNLKSAKDALLENVKNNLKDEILTDYNKDDYSEVNYQEILDKIDETFNNLEDLSDVLEFDYDNSELKNDLMAIPTILDEAISDALNDLDEAYNKYNKDRYTEENWNKLNNEYISSKDAIENSTTVGNVIHNLQDGINKMEAVESIENQFSDAKDDLKEYILNNFNKDDYSEKNWSDINELIDEKLEEFENIEAVEGFVYEGSKLEEDLNNIPTLLDEAKQDALDQLKDIYETYEDENYSSDNWGKLVQKYEDAKVAIEQTTSTEEINDKLNNGIEEMSKVPTILDEAKQDALDQLKDIYETYEKGDYSSDNWSDLTDAYEDAKVSIEESSNVEDVYYNLNDGIDKMSKVSTLEEELSAAKEDLKSEILKDYDENDYSEENYQDIVDKIDNALKDLDDIDEVNNFDDSNLKDELDKIPTLLDEAKQVALDQLKEEYESYKENDYSSDNWDKLVQKYEDAKVAIEQSTSTEEINNNFNDGIEEMSKVPTLEKELSDAKEDLKNEILKDYDEDDYSEENYQEISDIVDEALKDLEDIDEVHNYDKSDLKDELDKIPTILDEAKQVALDQLKQEYESYEENDYSNNNWSDLTEAYEGSKEAIEQSTSTEEINNNFNDGIDNMSKVPTLEDELNEAKESLKNEILQDYDKDDYSEDNYQNIVDKIDDALKGLDNVDEVDNFDDTNLKDELDKVPTVLDEAKQEALDQLKNKYESYEENDYSEENWSDLTDAYTSSKEAIEQSTSTEEINDKLNNGIEEMSKVPTLLDEAKDSLKNEILKDYDKDHYSEENYQEIENKVDEALKDIKDINDINNFEDTNLKDELDKVPTVIDEAKDSLKNEILKDYDENDYSEENYQDIVDKIDNALKDLDDIDEVNNFDYSNLKDELDKVSTILDDNNEELITKLNEIYNSYGNSGNYSDEGQDELEVIYEELLEDIQNNEYNDVPTLEKDAKKLFDQVDVIKSEEHDMKNPEIKYEDTNPDEYYSNVSNSEGMKKGYKVIVTNVEVVVNKKDKVLDYINKDKTKILDELINNKDIKNKALFAQLEISLVDSDGNKVDSIEYKGTYEVSFLLPEEFINRENIKVVYLSDDLVEVFKTEVNDLGWVTFETTHFSNFFLIADPLEGELETINLWWLIIIMLVIIVLEVTTIVWKRTKNNEERTYSLVLPILAVILPSNAYIIILILGIIIVLLLAYIIYLFLFIEQDETMEEELLIDEEEPLIEVKDELIIEDNKIDHVEQEEKLELNKKTEVSTKDKVVPPVIPSNKRPKTLYNYSFKARLHLADPKTLERFNEIKNYVLSYEGVRVSKSWSQETYLLNNESIFKVRVNGKTMNLFFNLDPGSFNDTKYVLIDRSNVKVHEKTPAQYQVNGPRKLEWAKELIDIYMKDKNSKKKSDYIDKDFKVEPKTMEQLIEEDLIKVTKINAEYEEIIFND